MSKESICLVSVVFVFGLARDKAGVMRVVSKKGRGI